MLATIYLFKLVEMAQQTIHNYSVMFRLPNCHTFVRESSPSNASVTVYATFCVHTFVCFEIESYTTSWFDVVKMSTWVPRFHRTLMPSPFE